MNPNTIILLETKRPITLICVDYYTSDLFPLVQLIRCSVFCDSSKLRSPRVSRVCYFSSIILMSALNCDSNSINSTTPISFLSIQAQRRNIEHH